MVEYVLSKRRGVTVMGICIPGWKSGRLSPWYVPGMHRDTRGVPRVPVSRAGPARTFPLQGGHRRFPVVSYGSSACLARAILRQTRTGHTLIHLSLVSGSVCRPSSACHRHLLEHQKGNNRRAARIPKRSTLTHGQKPATMPSSDSYLVIGGCGFLGRHIVEQLLERGESQVSVFDIVQRHFDK